MRSIPRTSWSSSPDVYENNNNNSSSNNNCVITNAATTFSSSSSTLHANNNINNKKKKLKVLCLHSFRTSADIVKLQLAMGGWDKQLEDSTEFMTVNGIFKATGEPPEDVKAAFPNMGSFQWYDAERNADTGKMEYKGIEESAKFVDEVVQREGIDGLLGFSQGATLIGEMLKRCSPSFERPEDDATTTTEGEEEAMRMKSLRFAVLISGMPSRADEKLSEQMMRSSKNSNSSNSSGGGKIIGASIPTLHVVGQQDRAIPPTLTKLMHKEFGEKAVLVEHEKGHVIPKVYPSNELGEKVKKFFDERLMEKNSNARL